MEHKKVIQIKAKIRPQAPTSPDASSLPKEENKPQSNTQSMYIFTGFVSVYVDIHTLEQCRQCEIATENVERSLFETYGNSSLEIRSDLTSFISGFSRYLILKISLKQLPILLEEYAKKHYLFKYDVIFDYGTSADMAGLDKDQYDTVAKIDRRVVGEEAFKAIARMYIGEDVDLSDIGYIQIQAPTVEYGK